MRWELAVDEGCPMTASIWRDGLQARRIARLRVPVRKELSVRAATSLRAITAKSAPTRAAAGGTEFWICVLYMIGPRLCLLHNDTNSNRRYSARLRPIVRMRSCASRTRSPPSGLATLARMLADTASANQQIIESP